MSAFMNPRRKIKYLIENFKSSAKHDYGLQGWDLDLFGLIDDLYQYALILEERIEKLEEKKA